MPILKPAHLVLATLSLIASCETANVPNNAPGRQDAQFHDAGEVAPGPDASLLRDAHIGDTSIPQVSYVDLSWRLRCPAPMSAGCAEGCTEGVDRTVNGYAADPGIRFSCRVTETATDRFISFTAGNASGQSLEFRNVQVPRAASSAVSGEVTVIDGAEYRGAAGSGAPSAAQPCQVSAVEFTIDPYTNDTRMRGQVLCDAMRAPEDSTLCRGMTAAGSMSPIPVQFDIYGCAGLVP